MYYAIHQVKEGEKQPQHESKAQFGHPLHSARHDRQASFFIEGEDLPLLSGTPQQAVDRPFLPEDRSWKQQTIPDMPAIDLEVVRAKDIELRRARSRKPPLPITADIFAAGEQALFKPDAEPETPQSAASLPKQEPVAQPHQQRKRRKQTERDVPALHLREALAPYIDIRALRRLASDNGNLQEALTNSSPPQEVLALLNTLAAILRPAHREQITCPADVAGLLMVEMGYLAQEQLRVVCLNTKNYVQAIHLVYQGNLNSSPVRIAEVYREPLRLNSAAIITAHNHPSSDPTPSPEDVAVTRQLVEAGKLLDIELLDHLVIGQGRWLSLRERRLGFDH